METFVLKMGRVAGTSEGLYETNREFYDEVRVDLSVMRVRAAALPKNELTVSHIDLVEDNINALEDLHKKQGEKGLGSDALVVSIRRALNQQFTAIIKLELAKKRGG